MGITSETRRESYEHLDNASINKHIINTLGEGARLTAREIAYILYTRGCIPYPVRQAVAPRLTELTEDGIVETIGKKLDEETGRSVAVYRLVRR